MRSRPLGATLGRAASVRPAAFDPSVVQLRLADDTVVPSNGDVTAWVEQICAAGDVATIRTSALYPRAAQRFRQAGFAVADTLALLRADLDDPAIGAALAETSPPAVRVGSLRRGDLAAAAGVDRRAFGARWCHDVDEIDQIRDATPHARARASFARAGAFGRELLAYAISGAAAGHGYLQRLAVDPPQQRRGHGRALTVDALRWMAKRRLRDCLVNTSVANTTALALYRSIGFHPLNEQLEVLELDVRAVR